MSNLSTFVWSIADQLRGPFHQHQYGEVILPFTVLRRLDCIMEPHREQMAQIVLKESSEMSRGVRIQKVTGLHFHNTTPFTLPKLLEDADSLDANLSNYVHGFSKNIDVFDRFKFDDTIKALAEKDRLYLVVRKFAETDLHPDVVSNAEMGDLFEDLIRRFAEASNQTAGDHFTPRDAVRLVVDLAIAEDTKLANEVAPVRTVYDPTAGTGGMLSLAEEQVIAQNPKARLRLFGQEINDQSYAICKSDLLAKGQDPDNIRLADTLSNDQFPDKFFDYCLANPPYGVDWKASEKAVKDEAKKGAHGRFGHGLPAVSDGQMLFLCHLVSKMRAVKHGEGGGRVGIVLNGSPLFNGGAESGPSEIRRWLLESDLLEAIVALPTDMFFNTGIATFVWVLDNNKRPERRGKVQLIDATGFGTKTRKSLGSKRVEISDEHRARILEAYAAIEESDISKVFDTHDFGYWSVTVERPLRLTFEVTDERLVVASIDQRLKALYGEVLTETLAGLKGTQYTNREVFRTALQERLAIADIKPTSQQATALMDLFSERDATADICGDPKGQPEPDTDLRDTENIPFGWRETDKDTEYMGDRKAVIDAYVEAEVLPHVPDAWVDHTKTKVGYEIPFTRHFYTYAPPRRLEEIDADLERVVADIMTMLREVER